MILIPDISTSLEVAVTSASAAFASSMISGQLYSFVCSTNCWIKQASPTGTITVDTNANMADGDIVTINDGTTSVVYEYDKTANGVTGGRVAWAVGTTAASVAANLKTAINATQTYITVTDNLDGSLTLSASTKNMIITKTSSSALAVVYGPLATAAALSMFVPALVTITLDGKNGSNCAVLRDSADGKSTLVHVLRY